MEFFSSRDTPLQETWNTENILSPPPQGTWIFFTQVNYRKYLFRTKSEGAQIVHTIGLQKCCAVVTSELVQPLVKQ